MQASQPVYDVIICGGGPGGVMAAITAGRLGLRTLLIERYGFLGGMNTAGLVGPVMTFHAGSLQIVRGTAGRVFDRLKDRGGTPGHLVDPIWGTTSMTPIDTEAYKTLLMDEIAEAGVELLLHSQVLRGEREGSPDEPAASEVATKILGRRVASITIANKLGLTQLRAKYYIDATGDGDLAAHLGCEFTMGRSSDRATQPMTLMFKMAGVDLDAVYAQIAADPENFYLGFPLAEYLRLPGRAVSGFFREVKVGRASGEFPLDRDRVLFFGQNRPDEITVNTLRINGVNGTEPGDLTRAESTLRRQVPTLVEFMVKHLPGFKKAYLVETAAQVGVRETRHILGDYVLRAEDVLGLRTFSDVVAHASYPIDIHSPDGSGMQIVDHRKANPDSYYDIPLRCLIPRGLDNLLVTGRCISAEHEASASTRISATCMALGEASATAVYTALQGEAPAQAEASAVSAALRSPRSLREIDVKQLQRKLRENGAFLQNRDI